MTDLDKLIEAVEWGLFPDKISMKALPHPCKLHAMEAYDGSLDAAKALLEELLPGWGWEAGINSTFGSASQVWKSGRDKAYSATDASPASVAPARAFLLAILKAYRSLQ